MIDIKVFQNALLIVCILAFLLGTFGAVIMTSASPFLRWLIKGSYIALAVLAGLCAALLVMLA